LCEDARDRGCIGAAFLYSAGSIDSER
jgi:hypothetical protein